MIKFRLGSHEYLAFQTKKLVKHKKPYLAEANDPVYLEALKHACESSHEIKRVLEETFGGVWHMIQCKTDCIQASLNYVASPGIIRFPNLILFRTEFTIKNLLSSFLDSVCTAITQSALTGLYNVVHMKELPKLLALKAKDLYPDWNFSCIIGSQPMNFHAFADRLLSFKLDSHDIVLMRKSSASITLMSALSSLIYGTDKKTIASLVTSRLKVGIPVKQIAQEIKSMYGEQWQIFIAPRLLHFISHADDLLIQLEMKGLIVVVFRSS